MKGRRQQWHLQFHHDLTMVPARNLLRRQYHSYGCSDDTETTIKLPDPLVRSNILPRMAINHQEQPQEQQKESEDQEAPAHRRNNDSWLQLGIVPSAQPGRPLGLSLELELSTSSRQQWGNCSSSSSSSSSNSNSTMMAQYCNYNVQRFPFVAPPPAAGVMGGPHLVVGMPERRRPPQAGVWFLLKAAENQVREPFLPQIPKSYLRIKDCRMTIRLLTKYLVNKLGLRDESEVQISCRGHALPLFFTLQHVRDSIWRLSEEVAVLSDSPVDQIMRLQYSRGP